MNTHKKILIAEDERSIAQGYGEHLERDGYIVEYAYDGEEALKKAREMSPDLILLDVVMPRIDGMAVLKELKADDKTKDIPVIILTNLESSKNAKEAMESGSFEYLVKTNYSLEDISKRIADILK